jgi:hypothetical protein
MDYSRPFTLNLAKDLLASDLEFKQGEDSRYSFYETIVEYDDIEQKWVVVHSTEMQKRKDVTFDRKIQKKVKKSQKDLKDLKLIHLVRGNLIPAVFTICMEMSGNGVRINITTALVALPLMVVHGKVGFDHPESGGAAASTPKL